MTAMILGHSKLFELIKSDNLITGLCERELKNAEGCVFDLQLDSVFELQGTAFIGIEERETPDVKEIAKFNPKNKTSFTFEPGKYYLTKTIETINLPKNIAAIYKPRATTFRSGLMIRTGIANPGYKGPLYFGLYNAGPIPVEIELGARYTSIIFMEIEGEATNTYRGQWQGGRDTTTKREKQI